jgi:hypothetical protein
VGDTDTDSSLHKRDTLRVLSNESGCLAGPLGHTKSRKEQLGIGILMIDADQSLASTSIE